jgi:osmotically-inducible protein OsmY
MRAADLTDAAIREDVLDWLEWNVAFEADRLGVRVQDEVVVLTGKVPGPRERSETEAAIRDIRGVRTVINRLVIVAGESPGHAA